jgi:Kef-type K+ transport system membrane component KefB
MTNILITGSLLFLYWFIYSQLTVINVQAVSALLIGIMLLSAFLFASEIKRTKLPRLTGYMLMGVILGPFGFNFLTNELMDQLHFLENLALAFIGITAGGELHINRIKQNKRTILYILIFQIVVVFIGMYLLIYYFASYIPGLKDINPAILPGFALLFAALALSKSPATTIGIITELKAKGKLTEMTLTITVFKAIILVLLFPIIIAIAESFLRDNPLSMWVMTQKVLIQISGSLFAGILVGIIVIWYISNIKQELSLFLLGTMLTIIEIESLFGIEIMLTSLIAGIIVQNFSKQGSSLIENIEAFSLPVYVIFFCFAGASLHLDVITNALVFTLLLVLWRLILLYMGNYFGARLAKEDAFIRHKSWMGYIGQAGIALGLGMIIENTIPGEIGQKIITIAVATIIINEFLGPVLFKYLLVKAKETGVNE